MPPSIEKFIEDWSKSQASEDSNKDGFLIALCEVLGVDRPKPATGDNERDQYVFERKVKIPEEDGLHTKSLSQ